MLIQRHGLFLTVPEYVLIWSVLFQGNGNPCQKAGGCFPWKHAPLPSVNHLRNTSSNMSLSFSLSSALISRYLSISSKNVFSLSFLSASSCILWRRGECLQWFALSCAHQRNNFILREVWVVLIYCTMYEAVCPVCLIQHTEKVPFSYCCACGV